VLTKRSFLGGMAGLLGISQAKAGKAAERLPPVPTWRPSFAQPLNEVIDRLTYYTDGKRDFAVFSHGTCVVLEPGMSDGQARTFSLQTLADILGYHPDMNPSSMDDGNILVRYNRPAVNVVLREIAEAHWTEIEERHLDGLTPSEVLMTPLGPNKFDAFGMQALLGRTFMFMDAQEPEIVDLRRGRMTGVSG
jgi:hypothetical protein